MGTIILIGMAALLIAALIYTLSAPDRHATMTEEEFEEEARKKSLIGAALIGLDKAVQPGRMEHVLVQKHRVEKDGSSADGVPPELLKPRDKTSECD
jgi:hypothetical protein